MRRKRVAWKSLKHRGIRRSVLIALALGLSSGQAGGQTTGAAEAEVLFREGKALMAAGRHEQACPKLAASFRADPATGTLLALAYCHEQEGKTATAWAEYLESAARSKAENRLDRETKAREKAATLESRLFRVAIRLDDAARRLPGLRVTRNGDVIDAAAYGVLVPVDPGDQLIEATAPGYQPWQMSFQVPPSAGSRDVLIPGLLVERVAAVSPVVTAPPEQSSGAPPPIEHRSASSEPEGSVLPTVGVVTGGLGVIFLGVSAGYGLQARSKNDDSAANCDGDICNPAGMQDRNDALDAARLSTITFGTGIALVAAGAAMIVFAPNERSSGTEVSAGLLVGGPAVTVRQSF